MKLCINVGFCKKILEIVRKAKDMTELHGDEYQLFGLVALKYSPKNLHV